MDHEQEMYRIHLIFPQADYACECRFSGRMPLRHMLQQLSEILPPECLEKYTSSGKECMIHVFTGIEADMDVSAASLNLHDGDVFYVI